MDISVVSLHLAQDDMWITAALASLFPAGGLHWSFGSYFYCAHSEQWSFKGNSDNILSFQSTSTINWIKTTVKQYHSTQQFYLIKILWMLLLIFLPLTSILQMMFRDMNTIMPILWLVMEPQSTFLFIWWTFICWCLG